MARASAFPCVDNCSYRVDTTTGPMVVKSCPETDWINETTALTRLAPAPLIPTPTLLSFGHSTDSPWLALQWIDGTPASTPQARFEAGRAVRALHQLEAHRFGSTSDPADAWAEALTRTLADDLDVAVSAGLINDTTASTIAHRVATIRPYNGPPRMLHGDLKDVHLHTLADSLVALLDWGDATAGDPLYDVARYSLEGPGALAGLLDGYGPLELDEDTMRAYRLRFTTPWS